MFKEQQVSSHISMVKDLIKSLRIIIRGVQNLRYFRRINAGVPIIIGGCGRSGTTLLLSILGAHPQLHAISRETGILRKERLSQSSRLWTLLSLSADTYVARKNTAIRWVEKTPRNINNIPAINQFFRGNVKFIHIVRDGRDVILSRHPTKPEEFWVDTERWVHDVSNGLAHEKSYDMLLVRYERLIDDFDRVVQDILDFLSLPPAPEVLDYYKHTTVSENVAWESGVQQIHKSSVNKWKQPEYQSRVAEMMKEPTAHALLRRLDYLEHE